MADHANKWPYGAERFPSGQASESVPLSDRLGMASKRPLGDLREKTGRLLGIPRGRRRWVWELMLVLLAALIFLLDLSLPLGVAGGVPYVAVILIAFWSTRKRLPLVAAAGCTLLVVAGYFLSPAGGELWKVVANRALAVFTIWTTAALSYLRLQAVELQRESDARIRSIFETAPDGILSFDEGGIVLSMNPACQRLFGCRPTEVIGQPVDRLIDRRGPKESDWQGDLLGDSAPHTGQPMELRGRRNSGEAFPLHITFGEMRIGGRRVFTAILRDITDRKREERALTAALHEAEQARERVEALIRSVGDFLMVTDRNLRIIFLNKTAERMLGVSAKQIAGHPAGELLSGPLAGLLEHIESSAGAPASESSGEVSLDLPGQAGGRLFQARSARVLGRSAGAGAIITILRDVTRERTLDRLKSEFVSTAAHELNTPLTSIMGYTELLLRPEAFGEFTPEQEQDFLSEIYAKCENLAQIVHQLLDLSRIESGQGIPLEKAPCDLNRLIARITGNYRLFSPNHRFELDLPEVSPSLCLDGKRMEQVLENLLSNAVKYSPKGGTIRVSARLAGGGYRFSVEDQGIGMTVEQQANMFDKFFRADPSNASSSGLGLGMSIVRSIIDLHGGRIEVDSRPEHGTTVTVCLPPATCVGETKPS